MRKILGKAKLTYEELLTVIAEVEGILNSRPLCHIYDDHIEDVLTPSHLLFGRRLLTEPAGYDHEINSNSEDICKRARYVKTILNHFWRRWSIEYLTELREHHVCHKSIPEKQIKKGDVVIVHQDKLPRSQWKMGLILELYEGRDGYVRSCKLRTTSQTGRLVILNRPINKLYPLEIPNELEKDVGNVK